MPSHPSSVISIALGLAFEARGAASQEMLAEEDLHATTPNVTLDSPQDHQMRLAIGVTAVMGGLAAFWLSSRAPKGAKAPAAEVEVKANAYPVHMEANVAVDDATKKKKPARPNAAARAEAKAAAAKAASEEAMRAEAAQAAEQAAKAKADAARAAAEEEAYEAELAAAAAKAKAELAQAAKEREAAKAEAKQQAARDAAAKMEKAKQEAAEMQKAASAAKTAANEDPVADTAAKTVPTKGKAQAKGAPKAAKGSNDATAAAKAEAKAIDELNKAAKNNDKKKAAAAIEKVGVHHADPDTGHTALHRAAAYGSLDVIKILHAGGASLEVQNKDKKTALMVAEDIGEVRAAKLLRALAEGKTDLDFGCSDDSGNESS